MPRVAVVGAPPTGGAPLVIAPTLIRLVLHLVGCAFVLTPPGLWCGPLPVMAVAGFRGREPACVWAKIPPGGVLPLRKLPCGIPECPRLRR